jgi:hypothetical protein
MREYFIKNRINLLQGKHFSEIYSTGNRISGRMWCPKVEDYQDRPDIVESILAVPPSGDFIFTALKPGYSGVQIGKNNSAFIKYISPEIVESDEKKLNINIDISDGGGTELYLYGINNITDFGDLSDKYIQDFNTNAPDLRI